MKIDKKLKKAVKKASGLRFRDLQNECIQKGLGFDEVVKWSIFALQDWYLGHFNLPNDPGKLDDFDEWMEKIMISRGYKRGKKKSRWVFHPLLKRGTRRPQPEEDAEPKAPKIKKVRKPKKEKNTELGVTKGTKKEKVYQCIKKGYSLKKATRVTIKYFPDANPKSIKIWYNQKLKETEAK